MGWFSSKRKSQQPKSSEDNYSKKAKSKTQRYLAQKQYRTQAIYRSLGYLIVIVVISLCIDMVFFAGLTVTRSVALGATLNWLTHTIFTKFVFRYNSAKAPRHMINQLYLGQIVKWLLTLVGFALIFSLVRPINTLAVMMGYLIMLIAQNIMLIRSKQ